MAIAQTFRTSNKTRFVWFRCVCLATLVVPVAAATAFAQEPPPRFAAYPAKVWRGKVAQLDLGSNSRARLYRTLIRQQIRDERVNFAGHYTLATVGCGTGCSITAIVDARTGEAEFPKELNGWTGIVGDYEFAEKEDPWTYRASSRLLRLIGRPNIGAPGVERYGPSGIYYYEWTGRRLRLIISTPVGSYSDPDPPAAVLKSRIDSISTRRDEQG